MADDGNSVALDTKLYQKPRQYGRIVYTVSCRLCRGPKRPRTHEDPTNHDFWDLQNVKSSCLCGLRPLDLPWVQSAKVPKYSHSFKSGVLPVGGVHIGAPLKFWKLPAMTAQGFKTHAGQTLFGYLGPWALGRSQT